MRFLVMPCGAYYESKDADAEAADGTRLLTQASGGGIQRPIIPEENRIEEELPRDARVNCLLCCPVKRYLKVRRGWLGPNAAGPTGEPQLVVTCRIVRVVAERPVRA